MSFFDTAALQKASRHSYHVHWSTDDAQWVGTCDGFPMLSHLDDDPEKAILGIWRLVVGVETDG